MTSILRKGLLSLILLVSCMAANAQYSAWQFRQAITIRENEGVQKTQHQVLLNINTKQYRDAGTMKANGADIRFAYDCAGNQPINYFIEKGFPTPGVPLDFADIWVLIDTLKANAQKTIYFFYGNTAASPASSFDATFPPDTRFISNGNTTLAGPQNFSWFEIRSADVVSIAPLQVFVVNARKIKIDGTLDGNAKGYLGGVFHNANQGSVLPTQGPGGGQQQVAGAGAGYGGKGGDGGGALNSGGQPYGNNNGYSIEMGSGGGAENLGVQGGNGGGGVLVNGTSVEINGRIQCDGEVGAVLPEPTTPIGPYAAGGGSGGGVLIRATHISADPTSTITVNGGIGGGAPYSTYSGGGGGGGRIKIFYERSPVLLPSATFVEGAPAGVGTTQSDPGEDGTFYAGPTSILNPSFTINPAVNAYGFDFIYEKTGSKTYHFTSTGNGLSNYSWDFGDGSPKLSSASPTYSYAQDGTYNVCLSATSPCGTATICKSVYVSSASTNGAWSYRIPIKIEEREGANHTNYQVLLDINTKKYIDLGQMKSDGSDIRFATDCNKQNTLAHFVESGMNTTSSKIWVMLPSLNANATYSINMFFGNPAALDSSSFDNTFPVASRLIIPAGTTIAPTGSSSTYSWFEVQTGGKFQFPNPNTTLSIVSIFARRIKIDGIIDGKGAGALGGSCICRRVQAAGLLVKVVDKPQQHRQVLLMAAAAADMVEKAAMEEEHIFKGGVSYGDSNNIYLGSGGGSGDSQGANGGGGIILRANTVSMSSTGFYCNGW